MIQATLTYLHSTISTKRHRVRVPEIPMYIDALLGRPAADRRARANVGSATFGSLRSSAFLHDDSRNFDDLNRLAFSYRWSTRAIMLDKTMPPSC